MWLFLYLVSLVGFVIGSVVALYHCKRYGTKWDQTRIAATLYIIVSAILLILSVVLAISMNLL